MSGTGLGPSFQSLAACPDVVSYDSSDPEQPFSQVKSHFLICTIMEISQGYCLGHMRGSHISSILTCTHCLNFCRSEIRVHPPGGVSEYNWSILPWCPRISVYFSLVAAPDLRTDSVERALQCADINMQWKEPELRSLHVWSSS